jgi:hypothetical protein
MMDEEGGRKEEGGRRKEEGGMIAEEARGMEYDLPENYTNTFPVVFFFHGLGDTAKDAALSTGWREISSEKSLIVVFMQGNVRKFVFGITSRFFFIHGKTILMFVMNYFFGNHSGVLEKGHAKIFYGTHEKNSWKVFWVLESISLFVFEFFLIKTDFCGQGEYFDEPRRSAGNFRSSND